MIRFFVIFCLAILPIQSSFAQVKFDLGNKGIAYVQPPKEDANFALMGEFLGRVDPGDEPAGMIGLQCRSVGDSAIQAIAYRGGLPGQPNFKPEPMKMTGQRFEDYVFLTGGKWVFSVEKNICRVIDRNGKLIGELKRIKRSSPTLHAPAPEGATVLFDGTNTDQFTNGRISYDGLLMEGADVKPMFQDFYLHVEFRLPYMPSAEGQQRGNSGLYLQSRYECQVLDSFAELPEFNGLGSLYRFKKPEVSMGLPPLTWQTYDVQFTAPRWASDGAKISNAKITSWINGVVVQNDVSLPNKTGAGKQEEPTLLPIRLQNHGDPVRFRNIWIVDRGLMTMEFPAKVTKAQKQKMNQHYQEQRKKRAAAERKKKAEEKKAAAEAKKTEALAKSETVNSVQNQTESKPKPIEQKTNPPAKNKPNK